MGQAFSGVLRSSHLLLAGVVLAMLPGIASAVGLGQLKVKSALNEPLNAEIPLTSVSRREIRSLEAGMAPRGAYEALGIERPQHLSEIKFNVAKRLDGTYFLQLTTLKPYHEPFLHMLVQVEWAGGRLRREYTALIDPPYLASGRPSSITAPRLQSPAADYEPLPEPIADEVLKETVEPAKSEAPKKSPEQAETLPEPLPEEPTLINKQDQEQPVETAEVAETAPVLPEPIQGEAAAGRSIDQVEAEAFGTGEPLPQEPEIVAQTDSSTEPGPISEPYDRGEALLGPPHIPVIPVERTPEPAVRARASKQPIEPFQPEEPELAGSDWAASDQYRVMRGDTLYEIAQRMRRDPSVNLNQIMMAVYEANPRAFYGSNINNLRAGRTLQMPDGEAVRGRPAGQASRQFRAHYDSWQEHKLKLAQAKAPIQVASSEPVKKSAPVSKEKPASQVKAKQAEDAKAKAKAAAEVKAAEETKAKAAAEAKAKQEADAKRLAEAKAATDAKAKQEAEAAKKAQQPASQQTKKDATPKPSKTAKARQTDDLLRIVRASMLIANDGQPTAETESRQAEKERQALAKRMANLEESAESAKLQNKEIGDKVGKVQQNIENQKRLIEVENPSLAKGNPAAPSQQPAKPETEKPPVKKPLKVAETKKPVQRRPVQQPAPQKEASIVDTIMDVLMGSQFVLMMIGGLVLLGGAIFAIYMKRRRKTLADFEESILSADTTTDDLSTDSQDSMGDSGDTSFLSDFSQEGMGNIATDEVDPIAEADVYLAYGRDEQAEEILKDAISKHPERSEVKLKLLEIYHQRNDVSGFETLAEELYASGSGAEVWPQVATMGSELNPDNPMFKGDAPPPGGVMGAAAVGGAAAAGGAMAGDLDMTELVPGDSMMDDGTGMDDSLDFDIETPAAGGGETEIVSPPSGANDDLSMDFDMDMGGSDSGAGEDGGMDLDFNMDMDIGGGDESPADDLSGEAGGGEDFALDFNMDTADVSTEEESMDAPAVPADTGAEDSGLDFSMDFEDMAGDSGESGDGLDADSELSFGDDDDGLSFDMESDSGASEDSGADDGLSLDMGSDDEEAGLDMGLDLDSSSDDDLDLSSMDFGEDSGDDDGVSALDLVKQSGGGLPENEDGSLDFSLSSGGDDSDFGLDDDSGLDMSADLDDGGTDLAEAVGVAEADVDSDENWDEAATKLDLAKAYIDMGDTDGAKGMLDEVMAEGSEEQKAQASELAAQI